MSLKLGIFLCDQVSDKYRPQHSDYPEMFAALLPGVDIKCFAVWRGHFPEDLDCCHAWLATGSRRSVYEDIPWIRRMLSLIQQLKDEKRLFVGVCFGHQLLAHGLDGDVVKASQGWSVGNHTFTIHAQKPWMAPFHPQLDLLMMCQDQVVTLPTGSIHLASTPLCPLAMYSVNDHMLGIQGHPEFSRDFVQSLIDDRIDLMGEDVAQSGTLSLQKVHQGAVMGQWITHFIDQNH